MLWIYRRIQAVFLSVLIFFSTLLGMGAPPKTVELPDAAAGELGAYVNPFVGTGGLPWVTGMLWPSATVPNGLVKLGPNSCFLGGLDFYATNGYSYAHGNLLGFSHTILEGGSFRVTPAVGDTDPASRLKKPLPFSHEQELAVPGYYAVYLPTIGCLAELTAADKVGAHRYTFDGEKDAHLFLDATSFLRNGSAAEGKIQVDAAAKEVTGEARVSASFAERYGGLKGYFVARFNKPWQSHATWVDGISEQGRSAAAGDDTGADLNFGSIAGEPLELQVGISFVSLANARENLDVQAGGLDFESIRSAARADWEANLGKIRIESNDETVKQIFYTSLYHSMTMPVNFTDVNGDYLGFNEKIGNTGGKFRYYTDMSLWDTSRTVHPLYTLIAPELQLNCVRSLTEMAKIGGALPRWPSGGGYTGSMFGSPADLVIAETYLKGLTDFDAETAYEYMKKASEEPMPTGTDGRYQVEAYNQYGYLPADIEQKGSVSSTLEYAWADSAIAALGQALGKSADEVAKYTEKSMRYQNLFDAQTKYFRPKNSDGVWVTPFSPYITGYYNEVLVMFPKAYAEGGAQHYRWSVQQDPQGLIDLFGSKEYFVSELEKFMSSASKNMAAFDPGSGYWHGNQHNVHALYLFNEAGRPDLTQKWARWALTTRYGTGSDGLDGNDDAGTLSAWYVLSALGIYPVAGTARYWLGAPIVENAVLDLGGKTLTVTARNQSAENQYVQSVTLNGQRLTESSVLHSELCANTQNELIFEMGAKPAAGGGY